MKQARSAKKTQQMQAAAANVEFMQLRESFQERLHSEHSQLAIFSELLAVTSCDWSQLLPDIRQFAHRLSGAALVFEFTEIGRAANAVELTADDAMLTEESRRGGAALLSNMKILTMLLAHATDNKPCTSRH